MSHDRCMSGKAKTALRWRRWDTESSCQAPEAAISSKQVDYLTHAIQTKVYMHVIRKELAETTEVALRSLHCPWKVNQPWVLDSEQCNCLGRPPLWTMTCEEAACRA